MISILRKTTFSPDTYVIATFSNLNIDTLCSVSCVKRHAEKFIIWIIDVYKEAAEQV